MSSIWNEFQMCFVLHVIVNSANSDTVPLRDGVRVYINFWNMNSGKLGHFWTDLILTEPLRYFQINLLKSSGFKQFYCIF